MTQYSKSLRDAILVLVCFVLLQLFSFPAEAQQESVARAVSVQGTVEVQRVGETQWSLVKLNDIFRPGDQIRVAEKSRADIAMLDQSVLRLNANTTMTIQAVKGEGTGVIDLLKGAAHFFSRGPSSLEVQTPFAVAGVRGTEFFVEVGADKSLVTVFEGTVSTANQAGSVMLSSGQSAIAETGKAPALQVVARPRDAVTWALYYPPVLYFRADEFPTGSGWQGMVRQSLQFYLQGDIQKAFESIAAVPSTVNDPRFLAYRASLSLAVGRVDDAQRDIEQALNLNPTDSNALALQTIIAIVQNDKERALTVARQSVGVSAQSATALIALSYAQQAHFDLEGARASLQQAVELEPQNALAWARLAELHSSFGKLDEALNAAREAASLEPNLSRTQTVLGFAYLTRVETQQAREAFEKAIALDQADALPRLGLGLAKIREGDLQGGGREIEIAASLDSSNSLIRSYLGKTYYEEKRTGLDEREYDTAKGLDPQDPTPFFYGAIEKQTTNRPVEALQDLQKAIKLNDNRAVYRSRLQLDSDLAARSASLARIYSDLGFQELALVEGWNSVNTDPSNFSAHRFLADSYSVLPRHEVARVSELLQSQLLQPLNMTPIQPQLAESNLFLISAGGPGALSFNEFNPLFNRNGITAQTSGMVGENDTYAGEGVVSGIYKNVAFSVGGFHFATDGWRKNADQRDDIANAFLQYEISPATSIQGEYRYRDTKRGEVQLRFAPDDFRLNFGENDKIESGRLGFRHAFSPNSMLIGNFMYQTADRNQRDTPNPIFTLFKLKGDDTAYSGEMQHLFRSIYTTVVSGVGYFHIDSQDNILSEFLFPPPEPFLPPLFVQDQRSVDRDVRHTNLYVYSYTSLPKRVTLTIGGSGDLYNTDLPGAKDQDQFNPKVGITWNPFTATTVRGAVFRTLKRTLITNQTLEPTQVAGFNQFYDDFNATKAWRYGVAVDQKFPKNIYGGVEYSLRDMRVPFVGSTETGPQEMKVDWHEQLVRLYLFWAPHEWLALSTGYEWERFDRDKLLADGVKHVETDRVPLGINFFHPSGLSASLKATYLHQNGDFERINGTSFESGKDNFWILDAALHYRLPKRYGFITFGATNLLDENFNYFDTDRGAINVNPRFMPDRVFFGRITLALP